MVDRPAPERGVRQSVDGQDPGDPYVVDLLSRAVRGSSFGGYKPVKPPARRIDRYRLPGWSELAEALYLAEQAPSRKRRGGRPKGSYLIQSRAEIEKAYRALWSEAGRRPFWRQVALALGVDERTLRNARRDFGLDRQVINEDGE